jgi:hypothetical protein
MKRALTLTHAAKARNVWFVCLVAVAASAGGPAAFALDFMGPPRAGVDEGQFIFGLDLSYGKTDLDLSSGKWTHPTVAPPSGPLSDRTIDFETTKLYGTAGYGFAQNWEAFLGIGATKSEFGDDLWNLGEDFDSGSIGLGFRGGVKTTFLEFPDYELQLGALIQFDWASYDGKMDVPTQAGPDFVETDLWEMQIAVGATYWWKETVKLYAGPSELGLLPRRTRGSHRSDGKLRLQYRMPVLIGCLRDRRRFDADVLITIARQLRCETPCGPGTGDKTVTWHIQPAHCIFHEIT